MVLEDIALLLLVLASVIIIVADIILIFSGKRGDKDEDE